MLTRSEKEKLIGEISELWKNSKGIVFYDFDKMQAGETVEFRKEIKNSQLRAYVSKNTFLRLGAKNAGITISEEEEKIFSGQTGIVFSPNDSLIPCRVVYGFSKKGGKPVVKGGYIDGRFVDLSTVSELAEIPSKEAIYQRLAFSLNALVAHVAILLNSILLKLVYALSAVKNKKDTNN